ncbi:hypothetical protein P4I74_25695 [Bacillus cereus]|nr:hypothetical protein [Bacillus cereus]
MNTVIIQFGQGTEAWKDMREITKFLQEKGYFIEPYEEIGSVKLTKKISDELVDKKLNIQKTKPKRYFVAM